MKVAPTIYCEHRKVQVKIQQYYLDQAHNKRPTFNDDGDKDILNSVVEAHSKGDRAQNTDEEAVEMIPIRQQEEMQAIQPYTARYKEQYDRMTVTAAVYVRLI